MIIAEQLKQIVNKNCIATDKQTNPVRYWSEVIFAKCVFYAAPLSLIAIAPGILITLELNLYLILWLNIISLFVIILVGYVPKLTVKVRKIILMALIYFAAFVLLKEMGNFGPGLVYLLAVNVLILLLFPDIKAVFPFVLTLAFCIIYGMLIGFNMVNVSSGRNIDIYEWAAVSSNVLFLSALFSMIIPFLFARIRALLEDKNLLLQSEQETNASLQKAILTIHHKNTELEQFAFMASHDLQEPLRTVSSFIDKLKLKYSHHTDEKTLQYMHFITMAVKRMKQLIIDLLDYSKADYQSTDWDEVNLNELINDYKTLRSQLIEDQHATILLQQLPSIKAPKVPLTQTLHCLLDNAIKFARKNQPPVVEISCAEKNQCWEFQIKDNGIGIDPRFFDKIFLLFQQLHNREDIAGTGIGLAVAKKNVELSGGKIWVDSSPGQGASFYFTIPKNFSKQP